MAPGSYRFYFKALGENDRGELAPREDTRYATLMQPYKDPVPEEKPCLPCRIAKLLWALIIGLLLILIYCCCLKVKLFG